MVVAFNIISIKLWGVAMARGVGGKREPRKRGKEKKKAGKERERSLQIQWEVVVFARDKAKELNHIVSEVVCY